MAERESEAEDYREREVEEGDEKVSKEDAEYRKGEAFRRCGNCRHMHKDGSCEIVEGKVEPYMVCKYFDKRGDGMSKSGSKMKSRWAKEKGDSDGDD